MINVKATITIDGNDNLDFVGDDGKRIALDRSVAYIEFPNEKWPLRVLINKSVANGVYDGMVTIDSKKDKLVAAVDTDTFILKAATPPNLPQK